MNRLPQSVGLALFILISVSILASCSAGGNPRAKSTKTPGESTSNPFLTTTESATPAPVNNGDGSEIREEPTDIKLVEIVEAQSPVFNLQIPGHVSISSPLGDLLVLTEKSREFTGLWSGLETNEIIEFGAKQINIYQHSDAHCLKDSANLSG